MGDKDLYPVLPSIEDIISSQDLISAPNASSKVVRVGSFAIKFGGSTSATEAANLEYLSRSTDMPVPKFHTTFKDPHSTRQFIVMEYIDGMTLEEALPALSSQEKAAILMQIRSILHDLRSLPDPGYLGSVNRLPYEDGVFYDRDSPNPISGPFFSQVEFYTAIVGRFEKFRTRTVRPARTKTDREDASS